MLGLTEEQKERVLETYFGDLTILGEKYYYKNSDKITDGIELVVEDLADLVDINCASYERVEIEGNVFVFSKDLAGTKNFKTANQIFGPDHDLNGNLYDIWRVLEQKYPRYVKYIMYEIIKIYLFDLLVLNADRNFSNWGIQFKDGQVKKVYILDNEYSFDTSNKAVLDSHLDLELHPDSPESENLKNLEYFLKTSSSEFINVFNSMYNMLNPVTVRSCFENVEDEIGNDFHFNPQLFDIYLENYNAIGELFMSRGLR